MFVPVLVYMYPEARHHSLAHVLIASVQVHPGLYFPDILIHLAETYAVLTSFRPHSLLIFASRSSSRSPRKQRSPMAATSSVNSPAEPARLGFFSTNKSFKLAENVEKE